MTAASVHDIHYLNDVRWEYHDCMMLGDKGYLSAEIQKNLFELANISLEVPYRLNQKTGIRLLGNTGGSVNESKQYFHNSTTI